MSMYNVVFYCCLCLICQTSGQNSVDTAQRDPYILCENQDSPTLECPPTTIIQIKDAIYGRTVRSVCRTSNLFQSISCNITVTSIVVSNCGNLRACLPKSSSDIYGDPCRGTYKYLNVTYRCIKDERLASRSSTHITTEQQELFSTTDAQPSLKSSTHLPTQFFTANSSTKSEQQVSLSETGLVAGIVAGVGLIALIIAIFIFKRSSVFCFARKVPYAINHDEKDQTENQNVAYINSNTSSIEGNDTNYTTLGNETDDHNYTEFRNSPVNKIGNHTIEPDSYLNVCNSFNQNRQSSTTDATYEEVRQKVSTKLIGQTRETHHDYVEFATHIIT